MAFEKELEVALAAVQKAASLCKSVQHNLIDEDTVTKKDRSPVTIADLGTQAVVILDLLKAFPDDAIVGEEDSNELRENDALREKVLGLVNEQNSDASADAMLDAIEYGNMDTDFTKRYWTLDPIDGTKGFLRGDQYAIALGLVEDGEVVMGVLGCPNYPFEDGNGGLFFAVKGEGAFVQRLDSGERTQLGTDGVSEGANAKFCESVEAAHAAHDVHQQISDELGHNATTISHRQPVQICRSGPWRCFDLLSSTSHRGIPGKDLGSCGRRDCGSGSRRPGE